MDKRHALFYLIFLQWNSKVDSTGDDVFILKTKNLTNSIRYCKDNKGEFVGGPKIFCRNVITVSSENQNSISVWTGNFKTYSPWISLLGCFKVNYTRDTTFRTPVGLQQCIDECVSRQQHTVAYNQASKLCQCGFTECLSGKNNFDPCNQIHSDFDPLIGFFVYKVSFTLPFPNNGTETCYAHVMNTTLDVISGCSYDGYSKNNNFSGIVSNIKACEPMVDEKIIYHFRDVTEKYAVNATNEELLKVNQCQVQICEPDVTSSKTLVERRCNDSADGFFCRLEIGAAMKTYNITTLMEEKTTSGYTTSNWLSTKPDNQTTEEGLTAVISTLSTDESSGYESSTQQNTTPVKLLSKTLNSILSSESSEMSTVELSSTPDIFATIDNNFVSPETYSNDRTTIKYSSLSKSFSTNEQTVTNHNSFVSGTNPFTDGFMSTISQSIATNSRLKHSSQKTSTLPTTDTSTEQDVRLSSVIVGTSSGVAVLIVLIIVVVVVRRRQTKGDIVYQNAMHEIDGRGDMHNNENDINVDDKGYTMLQEVQSDNSENTSGYSSIHNPRPLSQNDGIYDHIQRSIQPKLTFIDNEYGYIRR